jgi:hypothetical protein
VKKPTGRSLDVMQCSMIECLNEARHWLRSWTMTFEYSHEIPVCTPCGRDLIHEEDHGLKARKLRYSTRSVL